MGIWLDCEQSLFCSKIRRENVRDGMRDIRAASGEAASCEPRAASSVGVGKRAKRETALVSYNDLDATLTGRIIHTLTVLTVLI